jgi:centrosomal protein CEP76
MIAFISSRSITFLYGAQVPLDSEPLQLPVTWDDELSHLLMPALVSYENEQLLGVSVGQEDFQQSIKATVPVRHIFKVRLSFTV